MLPRLNQAHMSMTMITTTKPTPTGSPSHLLFPRRADGKIILPLPSSITNALGKWFRVHVLPSLTKYPGAGKQRRGGISELDDHTESSPTFTPPTFGVKARAQRTARSPPDGILKTFRVRTRRSLRRGAEEISVLEDYVTPLRTRKQVYSGGLEKNCRFRTYIHM